MTIRMSPMRDEEALARDTHGRKGRKDVILGQFLNSGVQRDLDT